MAGEELSPRELGTTVRNLKLLTATLKELQKSSLDNKEAVDLVVDSLERTTVLNRTMALESLRDTGRRLQEEEKFRQSLINTGYSMESVNRLLRAINSDAKETNITFSEFVRRLGDAKLSTKELSSVIGDFFNISLKSVFLLAGSAIKFGIDADAAAKKASLIAGGPTMNGGFFSPQQDVYRATGDFIVSMALMGHSINDSINALKRMNFSIRESESNYGSKSNASYLMEVTKLASAFARLNQVTDSTANKLVETLGMKLNFSANEIDFTFQKLIKNNKGGALTNEQYISGVIQMIEANARYTDNISLAVPVIKEFDKSIRAGVFSTSEIINTFSVLAGMQPREQGGLGMLMRQYGVEPSFLKGVGNDPFAIAEATTFAGSSYESTMGLLEVFGKMASEMGYGEGKQGRYSLMSSIANDRGLNLNARQVKDLEEARMRGNLKEANFEDIRDKNIEKSDTVKMAEQIGIQTSSIDELTRMFKDVMVGKAINTVLSDILIPKKLEDNVDMDYQKIRAAGIYGASSSVRESMSKNSFENRENWDRWRESHRGPKDFVPTINANLTMDGKVVGGFILKYLESEGKFAQVLDRIKENPLTQ